MIALKEICLELELSFTANTQKIYHVNSPFHSNDLRENKKKGKSILILFYLLGLLTMPTFDF